MIFSGFESCVGYSTFEYVSVALGSPLKPLYIFQRGKGGRVEPLNPPLDPLVLCHFPVLSWVIDAPGYLVYLVLFITV